MKAQTQKSKTRMITVVLCIAAALVFTSVSHAGIEEHIVKTETGFYYTVQKGDTLWDLSEKFSDSPWQWPDLWHYNPEIENPHRIYPGQRIQIYKKTFYGKKPKAEEKKAPEPEPTRYFNYSKIYGVGFIREQAAQPLGILFQARRSGRLISTDDKVYIRPESGARLTEGKDYLLYRTKSPIRDPETKEYIGVQHIITGIVEISENRGDFSVGHIVSSFRDIQKNDKVMPFIQRNEKIALKPGVPGIDGKIIKSEDDWEILGDFTIAFIDKGSADGIEVGQQYQAMARIMESSQGSESSEELLREEVGSLIVLHTEKQTATALITNSMEDLSAGMPVQAMR